MSIFSRTYARGVTESLLQAGLAKFASVEQAIEVADGVGDAFGVNPVEGNVTAEKVAAMAAAIIEASEKLAEGTGSLVTGDKGHQENTPANAASQIGALAALDQKQRPQGMYAKGEKGVGQTDFKAPAAARIGVETPHPLSPGKTDQKSNSVNQFGKSAAVLSEILRKVASGTGNLVTGDNASQENTPANASSQVGALGALDEKQRPQGTYAKGEAGVGKTDLDTKPGAVGSETSHEKAPGKTDSGSNSITEQVASKSAAYLARFEETAQEYLPSLGHLDDNEKVAAVKFLMGAEPEEARDFLAKLAAEETAVSEAKECEKCHKSPCACAPAEKVEEKKEEEKKAADDNGDGVDDALGEGEGSKRKRHVDPYGYKGYKARGGQEKKASALLASLKGLVSR